jgi:hypothetical protein
MHGLYNVLVLQDFAYFLERVLPILDRLKHCRWDSSLDRDQPHPTGRPTPSAGLLDDLHSFDPATMTWALLSAADDAGRPSARAGHGFTSVGGLLYVHGGSEGYGEAEANGGSVLVSARSGQTVADTANRGHPMDLT